MGDFVVKNIIFDFGQVLVRFDPEYMTRRYVENGEDAALLSEVVFDRLYWDALDKNGITDEELITAVKKRIPKRLHAAAEQIYGNWYYNLPETEGMKALIKELREKGFNTYILSDISEGFTKHYHEIDILSGFDGYCFSAAEGFTKPRPEAFLNLLQKFSLRAEECIFIDDREINIKGAESVGIKGILFGGSAEELRDKLQSLI